MEVCARETASEVAPTSAPAPGPAVLWRQTRIRLTTLHATEFIDITDRLQAFIDTAPIRVGFINLQTLHTTTAIIVNEHEPLLLADFETTLEHAAPARRAYWHDDATFRTVNVTPGERINGHSHCRALLLGASACLNIAGGRLLLGRWQRVFFAELDGPREREMSAVIAGEAL